mgnify:FL=1
MEVKDESLRLKEAVDMSADVGILDVASARSGVSAQTFGVCNGRKGRIRVAGEGRGFGECLAELEALVSELGEKDVFGLSDEQLLSGAQALAKLASRLGAVRGRILVAIDEKRSWRSSGMRTLIQWNERSSGQSPKAATREIKRACALEEDLPVLSRALKTGEIFAEHVDVVRKFFSTPVLKKAVNGEGVQKEFVSWAKRCGAREFERRVRARALRDDPALGVELEKSEVKDERVAFAPEGLGMRVTGWLSSETSAILDTALSALMGRKSVDDARTLPQRRASALIELASLKLDEGSLGRGARIRPHLSVHVPLATLVGAERAARPCASLDVGLSSDERGDQNWDAAEKRPVGEIGERPDSSRSELETGSFKEEVELLEGRIRSFEEKRQTAGRKLDGHCEAGGGQGRIGRCLDQVREESRELGKLLAVMPAAVDLTALKGLEPATLDDGSALSMTQLARLMCDSSVSRVVFSSSGEVMDVGREKRLFTPAQARAVVARDRTCRYPGCSDTIAHGQIHHALPWQAGGRTDLANAVLLCWHHHSLVHREMVTIFHHDGGFLFSGKDGTVIGVRRNGT